jgi:hypothetical protein
VYVVCSVLTFIIYLSNHSLPIDSEAALRQTRQYDPPIEAVVRLSKTVEKIQAVDESFGIAPPKSLCGRVMNVFVWEEHQWHYIQSVCKIGSFLRIRNGDYGKLFWDQAQSHCKYSSRFCSCILSVMHVIICGVEV